MIPRRTSLVILLNVVFLIFNICLITYTPPMQSTDDDHRRDDLHNVHDDLHNLHDDLKGPHQDHAPAQDNQEHIRDCTESRAKDNVKEIRRLSEEYSKLRETYVVPPIKGTDLVNCADIIAGKESELKKAESVMSSRPKMPLDEDVFDAWTDSCDGYKRQRGYITVPLSEEEQNYPLAYSVAMYTDVEQAERLLRSIYQPQNLYCFHIDIKSSLLLHRTMQKIADCFPNVFIAEHLDKIKWGDVSVLLPAVNCMRHLMKYYKGQFKYYINLTGQEMMLRTNWEMVQIAKIFNGGNDIAGSTSRMEYDRVNYKWGHRWSRTYQQMIFYNKFIPKTPPAYNLTFFKGELHGFFSHNMVKYIVEDKVSQDYLSWCWDSGHPSEHYWNVLNYNTHLRAPGGYEGPLDEADEYSFHPAMRVKNWVSMSHYDGKPCEGKVIRGICVYGLRDVPWLAERPEMAANKLHLTYHYLAYDCLEERLRNRTALHSHVPFPETYYRNLPTVKYSRKDGLDGLS